MKLVTKNSPKCSRASHNRSTTCGKRETGKTNLSYHMWQAAGTARGNSHNPMYEARPNMTDPLRDCLIPHHLHSSTQVNALQSTSHQTQFRKVTLEQDVAHFEAQIDKATSVAASQSILNVVVLCTPMRGRDPEIELRDLGLDAGDRRERKGETYKTN